MFANFLHLMLKYLLLIPLLIPGFATSALAGQRPCWLVGFNNKELFKGFEVKQSLVLRMQSTLVSSNPAAIFTIEYKDAAADKNWRRTYYITDQNDQTIHTITMQQPTGKRPFKAALLVGYAKAKKPVYVYTTLLPKDPQKAAVVRVRRILLCTIEWL